MKKNIISFVFLVIMIAVIPAKVGATEYYVDGRNGSDGNPGTMALPWKTLWKANSAVRVGDTVYISGPHDEWDGEYNNQQIAPSVSGYHGAPITFAASLIHPNPVIGGARVIGWTRDSGNRYFATFNKHPFPSHYNSVYQDGEPLKRVSAGSGAVDESGEYYWDSGSSRLYVYCYDQGKGYHPGNYTIRVGQPERWVSSTDRNYIILDGLTFVALGTASGVTCGNTSNNWTIRNCTFRGVPGWDGTRGSGYMISIGGGSNWVVENNSFEYAGFYRKWTTNSHSSDAIWFSHENRGASCDNIQIVGNTFRYWEHNAIEIKSRADYDGTCDGLLITNNLLEHGKGTGINISGGGQTNCIIEYNFVRDITTPQSDLHGAIWAKGNGTAVRYNITLEAQWGIGVASADYPATNIKVYNNVCYSNDKYGIFVTSDGEAIPKGIEIYGNISVENGSQDHNQIFIAQGETTLKGCEYNLAYRTGGAGSYWYYKNGPRSLSDMQKIYRFEDDGNGGLAEDPDFVNPDLGDFRLKETSNCINRIAMHPIPEWNTSPGWYPWDLKWEKIASPYGVLKDMSTRQETGFDIGACEYIYSNGDATPPSPPLGLRIE